MSPLMWKSMRWLNLPSSPPAEFQSGWGIQTRASAPTPLKLFETFGLNSASRKHPPNFFWGVADG